MTYVYHLPRSPPRTSAGSSDVYVDRASALKLAFHDADTDTDIDSPITATILRVRHTLFPREDPREDVRVGVGVVEFQLLRATRHRQVILETALFPADVLAGSEKTDRSADTDLACYSAYVERLKRCSASRPPADTASDRGYVRRAYAQS